MGSGAQVSGINSMVDLLDRLQRPLGEQGMEEVKSFISILVQPEQVGNCLDILLRHSTNFSVIECALSRFQAIYNHRRHEAWVRALANVAEQLWKCDCCRQSNWLSTLYKVAFSQPCQDQSMHHRLLILHGRFAPPSSHQEFGIRLVTSRVAGWLREIEEQLS